MPVSAATSILIRWNWHLLGVPDNHGDNQGAKKKLQAAAELVAHFDRFVTTTEGKNNDICSFSQVADLLMLCFLGLQSSLYTILEVGCHVH